MSIQLNPYWWLASLVFMSLFGFVIGLMCGRSDRNAKNKGGGK